MGRVGRAGVEGGGGGGGGVREECKEFKNKYTTRFMHDGDSHI